MKKLCSGLTLSLISLFVSGQVTMQTGIQATGVLQKSQLWNITIINAGGETYNCKIDLLLKDRISGEEIMTGSSSWFFIGSGAKQLNASSLAPVQYNYFGTRINNSVQGFIPPGNYSLCYQLSAQNKETILAEDCLQFDCDPLSPPLLTFPQDSSDMETAPTQFSWVPPGPSMMFNELKYDLIIVNVKPGQKPEQAIVENAPFYSTANLFSNLMGYSGISGDFEKNSWYAWQVVARDGGNYAGKSEVWTFRVKENPVEEIIKLAPYIKLTEKPSELTTVHQGVLKLEYYNYLADTLVKVSINEEGQKNVAHAKEKIFELDVRPGQNYLQYDLSRKMRLEENRVYELVLTNSRGQKFLMRFKYKNYQQ